MKVVARVRDAGQDRVRLDCDAPASTCGACAGGRGCALRWLARAEGPTLEVPASRGDGQRWVSGDTVVVEVPEGELLRAAARAYLPPLAGLLGGPALAAVLPGNSELAAVAAAVVGITLGWVVARAWLRRVPPRYRIRAQEGA